MTKEDLANLLNGREYGEEMTEVEARVAKENGLVVVYGYSDDNMEFRGAIDGEYGSYRGSAVFITKNGHLLDECHECDCDFCGYAEKKKQARKIDALWDNDGYSWTYQTDIPHATFDILEDGEKYCRGIVFELAAL